ncbi:hypothetical protein Thivi_1641 [Thiocystis violascens DSM 198]|uniref:Uncharacterized protein n=1 Tax=Thiocystis violascens (strain ATCC 17096 / DSM 198 / 6111) TaxID=765911 RepID=I3Y9F3_THIV6|nr:hypothetical protein Thivi_1641 [Thiocystis violascens DSM 198]
MELWKLLNENKEWLFSGIVIAALGGISALLLRVWRKFHDAKEWLFSGIGMAALGGISALLLRACRKFHDAQAIDSRKPFPISHSEHSNHPLDTITRNLICDTQGNYAQFAFFSAEFHKNLSKSIQSGNVSSIVRARTSLELYLDNSIIDAALLLFRRLQEYFSGRSSVPPRCCLKVVRIRDNEQYVSAMARDDKIPKSCIYRSDYLFDSHSLFREIASSSGPRSGKGVVLNNIPKEIATSQYENARINKDLARDYWHNFDKDQGSSTRAIASTH